MEVFKIRRSSCWVKLAITATISAVFLTRLVSTERHEDINTSFDKPVDGNRLGYGQHREDHKNTGELKLKITPNFDFLTIVLKSGYDFNNYDGGFDHLRVPRSSDSHERTTSTQIRRWAHEGADPDTNVTMKRDFIKTMMLESWNAYKASAWGANELAPVSKKGSHGGLIFGSHNTGATIIESLSTLYIMEMTEEFDRARNWVSQEFHFKEICKSVSLFEITTRILGGLLGAYGLSHAGVFLEKATEVADSLLPAFDTPHGIPYRWVKPCEKSASGSTVFLSELGTLHLEFVYLSDVTKNPIYAERVEKIRRRLKQVVPKDGLYKLTMNVTSGTFNSDITSFDGGADSFYEYLLKSWVMTGDREARKAYDATIEAMISAGMFQVSSPSHLLYIGSRQSNGTITQTFSHLACISGGILALGAVTDPERQNRTFLAYRYGANVTNTCHESYVRTATGLGPEKFSMESHNEARSNLKNSLKYILRAEVIESYFYLYRFTKDRKYRDWAWEAAQAIYKHCRVRDGDGYSGVASVNSDTPEKTDIQQSFFLAETLKYLYLIFSSDKLLDLNMWVFNAEAHPLPILWKNPMCQAPRRR